MTRLLTVLILTLALASALAAQMPRDRRHADPVTVAPDGRENALRKALAAAPDNLSLRIELAKLQEEDGRFRAAETTLLDGKAAVGANATLLHAIAGFYNRQGDFDKTIQHLEDAAALDPSNPQGYHLIATFYQEKVQKDFRLTQDQKRSYTEAGLSAADRALALNPNYVDALVYKNVLLRVLANLSPDRLEQQRLLTDADALRNRAMELQRAAGSADSAGSSPTPAQREQAVPVPRSDGAYRVGGPIRAPRKVRHLDPIYPPEALAQRVQGVVILEIRVEPDGSVSQVHVLRSIPLLDEAARDAVHQWRFEPSIVGGQAVPIIMTVTVNFTLPSSR